ncbi:MAG TPA: FtsX-like permease family protein [Vicinamibacteria bacterium]|jgi:ABC-type lipoprotein release transport system permease subunit
MTPLSLLRRSLVHYWRTHLAVLWGVATAVGVLAGALLVGESVRASLRDLFLSRLGNTTYVISSSDFFREELASDLESHRDLSDSFAAASPLIALEGMVIHEASGRRSSGVQVYGVDERFWAFHGWNKSETHPTGREVLLTESLARELGASPQDTILLRVEQPSDVPAEFLHGRRDQTGRTIRLSDTGRLSESGTEAFSIRPQQGDVYAAFVPLQRLQVDLDQEGRVNTILVSDADDSLESDEDAVLAGMLGEAARLEDLGVTLAVLEDAHCLSVTSDQILIRDGVAEAVEQAASRLGLDTSRIFTYLANTMRSGSAEVPYSLVAALDDGAFDTLQAGAERLPLPEESENQAIVLNDWAALDLGVRLGDRLTLDYYVWTDDGRLESRSAEFQVSGIVPIEGAAGDPDLAPTYPGITDSNAVSDWDPPFPIELDRVRPKDEEYWELYRATPKAFIPLARGQELWGSRYGALTSIRVFPRGPGEADELPAARDRFAAALRETLDLTQAGLTVYPVRAEGLRASQGATDFGEYFVYFSFFLVVSALLLTALFFRLGVEQRLTEIGILGAMGFPAKTVRRLFLREGMVLAVIGSVMGLVGAVVYAAVIMFGLRTWWIDAVGTRLLTLHASPTSLLLGGAGGVLAAVASIAWTLRAVRPLTPRSLLSGAQIDTRVSPAKKRRARAFGIVAAAAAGVLLLSAWLEAVGPAGGFFGAGSLLLLASLAALWSRLAGGDGGPLAGHGIWAVSRLGFRNVTYRPGRSLLCVALIAFATFVIVAVDAFRRDDRGTAHEPRSGTGGYPLMASSQLPLLWNPSSEQGWDALGLEGEDALAEVRFAPFRVRRGEDASCLNLYRPQDPEIMAPTEDFLRRGRFVFSSALSETPEEAANPWLILERSEPDGAIPVIGDANSMTYVLHLSLGDVFELERVGAEPLRLRLVAMLRDSIFQGELLMSEPNFFRAFPDEEGFRFFLLDVATESTNAVVETLEGRLADFGFDVIDTASQLASFHRVENTYLSTFQTLGGLGLVLGTFGLAAVLLRNVLERRRELALLRAVGYRSRDFSIMVLAENAVLLFWGLASGTLSALVAIAPAFISRGGVLSLTSLTVLLLAVLVSGVLASWLAVAASVRAPVLESLRAE